MKNLPSGWVETTLGNVCTKPQYGWTTRADPEGNGLRLLRTTDITPGVIDWDRVPFCTQTPPEVEKYLLAADDILVSRAGSVGVSIRISGQPPPAAFASYLIRFRTLPGTEPAYVSWYLKSPAYWRQIAESAAGIALQNVNAKKLAALAMPLPPTNEQQRIVAAIEEHFSRLDDAEESLRLAHRRLGSLRTAMLAAALDGWPERALGGIANVFVGTTPSRSAPELWSGDVPWVSSGEVAFCRIRETRETISPAAVTSPDRIHPPGTVLLAMIGEGKTRGQAGILDVAATHNQNSAAIRLDPELCTPEWLFYVLMARYEETRRAGSGAQQPALNRARVEALRIPLPPLENQRRLVEDNERQLSLAATLTGGIDRARRRSATLRRSILEQAFCGKLVPQDGSDEPASVLIERIAAERAAAPKPSRRNRKITA
jgi:type I restriction enzyme S subunit